MFSTSKKGEWYGVLQAKSGEVVVIYDGALPKATQGKIYFYNTQKDKIIEYVEEIVTAKLTDLKGKELEAAKHEYGEQWSNKRYEFLPEKGLIEEEPEVSSDSNIDDMLSDIDEDDVIVDDDLDEI